jgi:predicted site-specific integrase-resolvase
MDWMSTRKAAYFLGVSISTLEKWRAAGQGPPVVRLSKKLFRYRRADLLAFAEAARSAGGRNH